MVRAGSLAWGPVVPVLAASILVGDDLAHPDGQNPRKHRARRAQISESWRGERVFVPI
jgi:hypothetical protein